MNSPQAESDIVQHDMNRQFQTSGASSKSQFDLKNVKYVKNS